jgi:hypothetical protein
MSFGKEKLTWLALLIIKSDKVDDDE